MSQLPRNLTPAEGPANSQGAGSSQIQKTIVKLKENKKRKQEEDDEVEFEMTEEQILDMTERVRKTSRFLLSLLPKLDKCDRRRLEQAHKPVGSCPTTENDSDS